MYRPTSGIEIGKELISLKEVTPHGEFTKLVEARFGFKKRQQANYMRIADKFGGQKGIAVPFSTIALLELSKSPDPETALEIAKDEEKLTQKKAQERRALAGAHFRHNYNH